MSRDPAPARVARAERRPEPVPEGLDAPVDAIGTTAAPRSLEPRAGHEAELAGTCSTSRRGVSRGSGSANAGLSGRVDRRTAGKWRRLDARGQREVDEP